MNLFYSNFLLIFFFILALSFYVFDEAYAQEDRQFGYDLHPKKLLENSEGIIQIYSVENSKMIPIKIEGLKVTSSNNKVVKIIGFENNPNDFVTDIKISAIEPGTAKIAIAAPGYSSTEIPVTVFTNNKFATKISMKITPDDFPVDGPRRGFISLELLTTDDFPVKATEDIIVTINTPNNDVIDLKQKELTIKTGKYYAIEEFTVKNPGDAIIFADAPGMKRISELVHVRHAAEPLKIKLYSFPSTLNSLVSSKGYVIAQLQDSEGIPLKTSKDINISLQVTNPDASLNTSSDFEELIFTNKKLKIEKGSYWGYTSFSPRPDLEKFTTTNTNSYEITLSTEDYVVEGTTVNITHQEALLGEGPAILELVPILTSGESELIGVVHLFSDIPVIAKDNLKLPIESSSVNTVKGTNVVIKQGENAALVFAKTGSVIPNDDLLLYLTDSGGTSTYSAIAEGPLIDDLDLVVEPLISKVLAKEFFPLAAYLLESEGDEATSSSTEDEADENGRIGVTNFIQDGVLTFSANSLINVEPTVFNQGQEYVLIDGFADDVGITTLKSQSIGFESDTNIDILSTDPAKLFVSFPKTIIPNSGGLITIQTLDIGDNPAFAKTPIILKLVSNNNIIQLPDEITIEPENYNTSFRFDSSGIGKSEISVLANDLPLAKFSIEVVELTPEFILDVPKYAKIDESYSVKLSADYPNFDLPLDDFQIEWNVVGGTIKEADIITNKDGQATIIIIPKDVEKINVTAKITSKIIDKSISGETLVVKPKPAEVTESIPEPEPESIFDSPVLIIVGIIGAAVAGIILFLKKTDRLSDLIEKITELKERLPEFRK